MTPYSGAMSRTDALDILSAMIPTEHRAGRDHHVEALTVAMDALTWFPLKSAPRDGTQVLLAVAPMEAFNLPGFICIGRWVEPSEATFDGMGKARRQRFEAAGGWWSSTKSGRPFGRPVLAWAPAPEFNFTAAGYGPDAVTTVGQAA